MGFVGENVKMSNGKHSNWNDAPNDVGKEGDGGGEQRGGNICEKGDKFLSLLVALLTSARARARELSRLSKCIAGVKESRLLRRGLPPENSRLVPTPRDEGCQTLRGFLKIAVI